MPEPWFASTLDALTPTGTPSVSSSGGQLPITSSRGITIQTAVSGADSPVLPERLSGCAGYSSYPNFSTQAEPQVNLLGPGGSGRIRINHVTNDTSLFVLQYWNGSTWVDVGTNFDLPGSIVRQFRIEWSGYGTTNGSISLRIFNDAGEALVATRSVSGVNFSGLSGIVQINFRETRGTQFSTISAVFICDDNGDTSYVYTRVANADGADTGGTGNFNSVNSTGTTYDSTFISLATTGLRRSLKNTANRNYDNRTVRAVSISARMRRGATGPSRATLYLTIGGVRYYHPNVQLLTTSFQSYSFVWETDPSTSSAWTLTNAQAASLEWGVEAVA